MIVADRYSAKEGWGRREERGEERYIKGDHERDREKRRT